MSEGSENPCRAVVYVAPQDRYPERYPGRQKDERVSSYFATDP